MIGHYLNEIWVGWSEQKGNHWLIILTKTLFVDLSDLTSFSGDTCRLRQEPDVIVLLSTK